MLFGQKEILYQRLPPFESGGGGGTGAVSSVFGRIGDVFAQVGDYLVSQVTGAVASSRKISTDTTISGGGDLTADRTLSVIPDQTVQKILVSGNGSLVGTRSAINFTASGPLSISYTDNQVNNRVDINLIGQAGAAQTPWLQDINAAGFKLSYVSQVNIGPASPSTKTLVLTYDIGNDRSRIYSFDSAGAGTNKPLLLDASAICLNYYTNGNVGIGMTSPSFALDVVAQVGSATAIRIRGGLAGTTNNGGIRFYGTYAASDLWVIGSDVATNTGTKDFQFYDLTGSACRLAITQAGNVGIGTSNPVGDRLRIVDQSTLRVYVADSTRTWIGTAGTPLQLAADGTPGAGGYGGVVILPTNGNVGIGTTNPLNTLQVHGATNLNLGMRAISGMVGLAAFSDDGNTREPMQFDASLFNFNYGNVGIGTASPAYSLDVATGPICVRGQVASAATAAILMDYAGGNDGRILAYGPNATTNANLELYSIRSDGSSAISLFLFQASNSCLYLTPPMGVIQHLIPSANWNAAWLGNGQLGMYYNEANNVLSFVYRRSDGALKSYGVTFS